ncbi:hypothetical protein [uncultured Tateyamaria sp.]|uniref:tetratricopeptide repeat protein n=1 Tax=uncultured Tateyamaria sp. TaxID=455651 RepID=UPI002611E851|nr:hypothetical protein [uncultured Tateyamaria sp.]
MTVFRRLTTAMALCATTAFAQTDGLPDTVVAALEARDFTTARAALMPLAEDADNLTAQFRLAALLLQGQGGPRDTDGAVAMLRAAAEAGYAPAGLLLGRIHLTGGSTGVDRDPAQAAAILDPFATNGNAEAQYYMALLLAHGEGVAQDTDRALMLLRGAADQDHTEAQYELSKVLSRGPDAQDSAQEALKWLTAAASNGHVEGQYFLALAFDMGNGVQMDKPAALDWYRRAAEGGLPIAQRTLGTKYLTGQDDTDPNPDEALRWLTAAAEAGDPGGMMNLAMAYGGTGGVPQNDAAALQWLQKASDSGLARATFVLAHYAETGRGMAADVREAALLYRKANEQGHADAGTRLGQLVGQGLLDTHMPPHMAVSWARLAAENGDDGARNWLMKRADDALRPAQAAYGHLLLHLDKDAATALPYLTAAAQTGHVASQFEIGTLYATGNGVDLNYEQAHAWFNIAATSGHAAATTQRDALGNLMTPDQISAAQDITRTFFATASDRLPANVAKQRTQP